MSKLLNTKKIHILDAFDDEAEVPEPAVIHAPSDAFNTRVRSAVAMLRLEIDPDEIRRRHGMIVLGIIYMSTVDFLSVLIYN